MITTYFITSIADCRDVLIDGSKGLFTPEQGNNFCKSGNDKFSAVNLPDNSDHIVFGSSKSAILTEFLLRLDDVCGDGGSLTLSVDYYNEARSGEPVSIFNNIKCG